MTEAEAKTKWCPMTRLPSTWLNGKHEPMPDDPMYASPFCIGSACMMWRTTIWSRTNEEVMTGTGERHGYCGLAGKPGT